VFEQRIRLLRQYPPNRRIVAKGASDRKATARERDMKPPRRSRSARPAKYSQHPFSSSELEEQRAAVSEVLRAISNSPHELQPIFDTITQSATRLCRAKYGNLRLAEAEGFRLVAEVSYPSSAAERCLHPTASQIS
jgi:hypothetical protein